jgi:hypothetical protein
MVALLCFFLTLLTSPFKSRSRLEAENAALRQQLIILQCKLRGRVHFTNSDRLFFIQLYRWFPSILKTITIIRPETLVRWHRAGFRLSAAAHTVLLRSSPAPVRYSSRQRRNLSVRRQGELDDGAMGYVRSSPHPSLVSFDDRTADR